MDPQKPPVGFYNAAFDDGGLSTTGRSKAEDQTASGHVNKSFDDTPAVSSNKAPNDGDLELNSVTSQRQAGATLQQNGNDVAIPISLDESQNEGEQQGPLIYGRRWTRLSEWAETEGVVIVTTRRRTTHIDRKQSKLAANPDDERRFTTFIDDAKRTQHIDTTKTYSYGPPKKQSRSKWHRFRARFHDFISIFAVWTSAFKSIEGEFGSSVLSYFWFLRWLLLINMMTSLVIVLPIIVPQAVVLPSSFDDTIPCSSLPVNNASQLNSFEAAACSCSANYSKSISDRVDSQSTAFSVLDFFQGTGWMESTYLFIGYYYDKTMSDAVYYRMSVAFLVTTAAYFLLILLLMVIQTSSSVKTRMVESGDSSNTPFCDLVLSGWDFTLTSQNAAKRKHKQLFEQIQRELDKEKQTQKDENLSTAGRYCLYLIRFCVLLIILCLLGGAFTLIAFVISVWQPMLMNDPTVKTMPFVYLIVQYLHTIALTVLNAALPIVFQLVLVLARLSPEANIRVYMIATVFLRLTSVAIVVVTSFITVISVSGNGYCGNDRPEYQCWETYIGKQMYTLVLSDFFVVVISTLLVDFIRKFMADKCGGCCLIKVIGRSEFAVPANALSIVYSQTLCWIGAFFSPLIPLMTAAKLFIFFYVKKLSLFRACVPSPQSHRLSQSAFFFVIILMISFVLCAVAVTFAIGRIHPSPSCGPFRVYSQQDYYMFTAVVDAIALDKLPSSLADFVRVITSNIFFLIIIAISGLLVLYFQVRASCEKQIVHVLQQQLIMESHDKLFALHRIKVAFLRGDLA